MVLSGRSAHGSLPEQGDNAIDKAVRFVVALHRLPVLRHEDELISPAAVVLQFHGGSQTHVIPDRAQVHLDVRIGLSLTACEVYKDLTTLAAGYGAEVRPIELAEPWHTSRTSDVVSLLLQEVMRCSGRRPRLVGFPAWTDAHNLVELAATETVVFGPGSTFALSHDPDERVDLREVVDCSLVIAGVLENMWHGR